MVRLSKLDRSHKDFKPLHARKEFNVFNRKLHKMLAKTSWYTESEVVSKNKWRKLVPDVWSGDKTIQYPLPGPQYTSLMQVPNSKDGGLSTCLQEQNRDWHGCLATKLSM